MSKQLRILITIAMLSLLSIAVILMRSPLDLSQGLVALGLASLAFSIIIGLYIGVEKGLEQYAKSVH